MQCETCGPDVRVSVSSQGPSRVGGMVDPMSVDNTIVIEACLSGDRKLDLQRGLWVSQILDNFVATSEKIYRDTLSDFLFKDEQYTYTKLENRRNKKQNVKKIFIIIKAYYIQIYGNHHIYL